MSPFMKFFLFLYDSLPPSSWFLVQRHTLASPSDTDEVIRSGIIGEIGYIWKETRIFVFIPILEFLVTFCLVMSFLLFIERVYMSIVVVIVKLLRRTPEKVHKWKAIKDDDLELANTNYPMVLIQIPMYNEKEVCQLSIGAACRLSWPLDRLIVQVLDDSTDPASKDLVNAECDKWARRGINIMSEIRDNRIGYKAGALKAGMMHNYVKQCEFVAIFDADFQPDPDFLARTIPFLIHNHEISLVQCRWKFVNANECLMTRMQEMSLNYHFLAEQESGSSIHGFFGFNGTAGVWRIAALNEAGGWKDRTTVEDMDLAVRACLHGWKFVYVHDVEVKNELPSTFKAYRFQQHRWSCGPANLCRKMTMEILQNKKVSAWTKLYLIYNFFFIRKIVVHIFTFVFYCLILPATVLFPELQVPKWATVYVPTTITILNALATPRSLHLLVFWILFENVMSMHRTKATFIGLLEAGRVNEWVVTEKLGDTLKSKLIAKATTRLYTRFGQRINWRELVVGLYIFLCGCYDFAYGGSYFYVYLFLQACAFLLLGLVILALLFPPIRQTEVLYLRNKCFAIDLEQLGMIGSWLNKVNSSNFHTTHMYY